MADSIKATGRILGNDMFEFTMDGMATASQMERLIKLTAEYTDKVTKGKSELAKAEKEQANAVNKLTDATEEATKSTSKLTKKNEDLYDSIDNLDKVTSFFKGNFKSASHGISTFSVALSTGVGTLFGALSGYADQLQSGLQRGISGGIMDFAIAAKTGGVNLQSFSKALEESGGGFASLGTGATEGAKNFGALIGSVRGATASVGNLGLSNDQLALFTAQQVKVAVSQGFKGKAAQEVVIKNSKALGDELDTLANRTGKSVLELTQAAIKLAQDPIVANFVQTAKNGGAQISKAAQQFGASLRGIFGEAGDAIASDALKTALGGLPLVITQTGKNMITASSAVYSELERQAKIVKNGGDITAADQEKLRDTVLKEVKARGTELRMLANFEGQAGDGARQLLALAVQAEFYASEAGAQRREEDKRAQAFNSSMNQLKANMQALSIPILKLINGIPWDYFIKTLNVFVDTLSFLMRPFTKLGEILSLGFDKFGISLGSVLSVVVGLGSAVLVAKTGIELFAKAFTSITGISKGLNGSLGSATTATDKFKIALEKVLIWAKSLTGNGSLADMGGRGTGRSGGSGRNKTAGGIDSIAKPKDGIITTGGLSSDSKGRIDTSKIEGNAARKRAYDLFNKPIDLKEEKEKKLQDLKDKKARLDELKKSNPNMSSAEALKSMRFDASAIGKATNFMKTPTGLGIGAWAGGAALDWGSEKLKENGQQGAGAITSVASGALSGASTGAMLGSVIPGLGTGVGALIGGVLGGVSSLVGEISEWNKTESSESLSAVGSDAVAQNNKTTAAMLAEQQKTNQLLLAQQYGIDATASFNAKQTSLLSDSVRMQRNGLVT